MKTGANKVVSKAEEADLLTMLDIGSYRSSENADSAAISFDSRSSSNPSRDQAHFVTRSISRTATPETISATVASSSQKAVPYTDFSSAKSQQKVVPTFDSWSDRLSPDKAIPKTVCSLVASPPSHRVFAAGSEEPIKSQVTPMTAAGRLWGNGGQTQREYKSKKLRGLSREEAELRRLRTNRLEKERMDRQSAVVKRLESLLPAYLKEENKPLTFYNALKTVSRYIALLSVCNQLGASAEGNAFQLGLRMILEAKNSRWQNDTIDVSVFKELFQQEQGAFFPTLKEECVSNRNIMGRLTVDSFKPYSAPLLSAFYSEAALKTRVSQRKMTSSSGVRSVPRMTMGDQPVDHRYYSCPYAIPERYYSSSSEIGAFGSNYDNHGATHPDQTANLLPDNSNDAYPMATVAFGLPTPVGQPSPVSQHTPVWQLSSVWQSSPVSQPSTASQPSPTTWQPSPVSQPTPAWLPSHASQHSPVCQLSPVWEPSPLYQPSPLWQQHQPQTRLPSSTSVLSTQFPKARESCISPDQPFPPRQRLFLPTSQVESQRQRTPPAPSSIMSRTTSRLPSSSGPKHLNLNPTTALGEQMSPVAGPTNGQLTQPDISRGDREDVDAMQCPSQDFIQLFNSSTTLERSRIASQKGRANARDCRYAHTNPQNNITNDDNMTTASSGLFQFTPPVTSVPRSSSSSSRKRQRTAFSAIDWEHRLTLSTGIPAPRNENAANLVDVQRSRPSTCQPPQIPSFNSNVSLSMPPTPGLIDDVHEDSGIGSDLDTSSGTQKNLTTIGRLGTDWACKEELVLPDEYPLFESIV